MKKFVFFMLCLLTIPSTYSQYPRDQKIIAAEYFINSDPGEGNGTVIATGGTPLWEVTVNANDLNVPVGSKMYIRFKSTNGRWSAPRSLLRKSYFENRGGTLQYGEYYLNSDPGQGNGQPLSFQNGIADISGLTIQQGDKLYVRIRDNLNRWSPSRPVTFRFKKIDKAEYYLKYGSGGSSNPLPMSLSAYDPYNCVYTATANNFAVQNTDTIFVSFTTTDKFKGPWFKHTAVAYILMVSPLNQDVNAAAGSTTFSVTSNTNWTASCSDTWCTVTPTGTGTGTITANFTQNGTQQIRVATIEVSATGLPTQTVTVTQAKPSSGIEEPSGKALSIYPNPAYSTLIIDLRNIPEKIISLAIADTRGIKSLETEPSGKRFILDVSDYHAGFYFIKIKTATTIYTGKFCKK
jgi:hypothetical protein